MCNKKKILFVNSCVRPEGVSRTKKMADSLLEKLKQEAVEKWGEEGFCIEELKLVEENLLPLDNMRLEKRSALVAQKMYDNPVFNYAKQFAQADIILIAAPFWDMSFPAILKIYFENVSVSGITFSYNSSNEAVGLCRAQKIYYVTTAGGKMYYNGGFEYVKGLCSNLFGIKEFEEIKKENLDAV